MKLDIQVDGVQSTIAAFDKVIRGTLDLRQLGTWDAVQKEFYQIEKDQFQSSGGVGRSGKWKELSPAYEKAKIAKYGTYALLVGPLRATDRLYKSLTGPGPDAVVDKQAQEMTLGSSVPYGPYHQRGGGRLPKREPISLTPEQEKQLVKPIKKKLTQLIDNAKLRDVRGF